MPIRLDTETQAALELAKRAVPEGQELRIEHLLCAVYHQTGVKDALPEFAARIPEPQSLAASSGDRQVAIELRPVLAPFRSSATPGTAVDVFCAIAASQPGRALLDGFGITAAEIDRIPAALGHRAPAAPASGWRSSPERAKVVKALSEYGRMLTDVDLRPANLFGVDETLRHLMQGLVQRKQHSVVLVGPPGVGKTVVVQEFARRLVTGDESILDRLRDSDVFELSPAFLKAGASIVGQFEERIKGLLDILTRHPKVIVFVDEVHSLLQSEMHTQGPWSGASAEFKKAVGSGSISLIGCTTLAEYRHYIEPDRALADRFTQVRIDPPTSDQTEQILRSRMPALRAFYPELEITDPVIPYTVSMADEYLLGRFQPRKSIRLLDQACAWCLVQQPQIGSVTEEAVRAAIEAETGQKVLESHAVDPEELFAQLRSSIVGQDHLLGDLRDRVVRGLGSWGTSKNGTRGNFFFAGPTGVGKTETVKVLAKAIGGGANSLIRIDCGNLQGSGFDSREAINTLLGAAPGFIGYVRGEGGLLSQIRDRPNSIVLFDEIEKADPGVAKLLLAILDVGLIEDNDGQPLDFRRAFIIFTSNAGVTYGRSGDMGFRVPGSPTERPAATVDSESVLDDIRRRGFPQEFLGRGIEWFVFRSLDRDDGREILRRLLESFRSDAAAHQPPLQVEWDSEAIDHLVQEWDPQFGARHLNGLIRNHLIGQLAVAEAKDELEGVTRVVLRKAALTPDVEPAGAGGSSRHREGDALVIRLHRTTPS